MNHSIFYQRSFSLSLPKRLWGSVFVWFGVITILFIFMTIVVKTFSEGGPGFNLNYLWQSPENAGRSGGIGPILVSTALILGLAIATAVPVGMATALLLSEYSIKKTALSRVIHFSLDTLAGVPSIVFGLFGHVFFAQWLGLGLSITSVHSVA